MFRNCSTCLGYQVSDHQVATLSGLIPVSRWRCSTQRPQKKQSKIDFSLFTFHYSLPCTDLTTSQQELAKVE